MTENATQQGQAAALIVLRLAVSLTCLAVAWQALTTGGPVFSWLFMNADWSELAAARAERAGSFALLAAIPCLFTRWRKPAAAVVFAWLLVNAIAQALIETLLPALVIPAQAARWGAPLALLVARPHWLLRGAIALTFAAHGVEALYAHPLFVDYLIRGFGRVSLDLGQASAENMLLAIGVIDLIVAVLILLPKRLLPVALYMAAWGFLTALARMLFAGLDAWPDALIRVTNGAVPLTLALLWVRANRDSGNA